MADISQPVDFLLVFPHGEGPDFGGSHTGVFQKQARSGSLQEIALSAALLNVVHSGQEVD